MDSRVFRLPDPLVVPSYTVAFLFFPLSRAESLKIYEAALFFHVGPMMRALDRHSISACRRGSSSGPGRDSSSLSSFILSFRCLRAALRMAMKRGCNEGFAESIMRFIGPIKNAGGFYDSPLKSSYDQNCVVA